MEQKDELYVLEYGESCDNLKLEVFDDKSLALNAYNIYNYFYDYCTIQVKHIIHPNNTNEIVLKIELTFQLVKSRSNKLECIDSIAKITNSETIDDFIISQDTVDKNCWYVCVNKAYNNDEKDIISFVKFVIEEARNKLKEHFNK